MTLKDVEENVEKLKCSHDQIETKFTDLCSSVESLNKRLDTFLKLFERSPYNQQIPDKASGSHKSEMGDTIISPSIDDENVSTKSLVVDSIPSAVDEEDGSLNLGLIPSFLFHKKNDLYAGESLQYEEVVKTDVIEVIKSNEFKIWEINRSTNNAVNELLVRNCVKFFSETLANVECLNELFFLHTKILGMDCSHFKLDDSRFLFDRGKCAGKVIFQLFLRLGYDSELRFTDLIAFLCITFVEIHGAKKMFVQLTERSKILLCMLVRVIGIYLTQDIIGTLPDSVLWRFTVGGVHFSGLINKDYKLAYKFPTKVPIIFKSKNQFSSLQEYASLMMLTSSSSLQIHLGIGFLWDYPLPAFIFSGGTVIVPAKGSTVDTLLQLQLGSLSTPQDPCNTIQAIARQPAASAIQYPQTIFSTFIYFFACCRQLLGPCSESEYLEMIAGVRKANDVLLLINLKKFTYFLVLNISVPRIFRSHWYCWQISPFARPPLLTYEVFWMFLLTVEHSGWICMTTYFCVWNFPSGCSQVKSPLYSSGKNQDLIVENIVGIQVSFFVIMIRHQLVRVEYLRWKFRFHYRGCFNRFLEIVPGSSKRGSFLHYLLHVSVFYGALTVLSKAEMAYLKCVVFVFLTSGHDHHAYFRCSQQWCLGFQPVRGFMQLDFDKWIMVSLRERYTTNWDLMLIHFVLMGMSHQLHHTFHFGDTAKYLIHCQLMQDNDREREAATNGNLQAAHLVVRGVIVQHSEACHHTNLGSTENFWPSAVIFAIILASPFEQPASQLKQLFVESHRQIAMSSGSTPKPLLDRVVFLLLLIYPADSTDDKAPVHPGEWRIRMAAQILLKSNANGIPMGSTSVLCFGFNWNSRINFPNADREIHAHHASATITVTSSGVCVGTDQDASCADKGNGYLFVRLRVRASQWSLLKLELTTTLLVLLLLRIILTSVQILLLQMFQATALLMRILLHSSLRTRMFFRGRQCCIPSVRANPFTLLVV